MANPIQILFSNVSTNTPTLGVGATDNNIALNGPDGLLFWYDGTTTQSTDLNAVGTALQNVVEDTTPQFAATLDMQSNLISNLAAPVSGSDAATKTYVDSVAQGLDVKASVRVIALSNINLGVAADPSPIDGVTLANGDRVLLAGQTAGAENGIYDAVTAADPTTWVRSSDADTSAEVTAGMFTFVEEGTANADTGWVLVTDDPITLDTTALSFSQFTGAGSIVAGDGLAKTGDTLSVNVDGTSIEIVADTLQIDAAYAGQTSITTLGTVATGTWNASVIALNYGGTGADLSAEADGTIFKKSGTALVAATAGTDYLNSTSLLGGQTF